MAKACWWLVTSLASVLSASCVGHIEDSPARPWLPESSSEYDAGATGESLTAGGPTARGSLSEMDDGRDPGASAGQGTASVAAMSGWPSFSSSRAFQLRRLTSQQYVASVESLLGVDTAGMPAIEAVSRVGGFEEIGASSASVSGMGVSQFEDAARFLAQAAFAPDGPARERMPCTPAGLDDAECFTQFVRSFGLKAFRRPLTDAELSRYASLTQEVATLTGDAWQGVEVTASALLQSPNFLYLAEVAEPDPERPERYRYGAYEMAARLAYFLTGDAPDDELLQAAEADALLTEAGIAEQVERLLAAEPAHVALRRFFGNLLSLDSLDTLSRPVELFPQFTDTLGQALKQETLLVIDDLVFERDGDYRRLFDQTQTFVNAELAALYGVPAPQGDRFARVTLPASTHRAGLLGQAGVLAARDHSDGTSPTRRGLFVLTRLLCQDLPLMPPANLQIPQPPQGLLTARERLDQHTTDPVCASCHRITDPVGLSLEHFDALGVYHDEDHGLPIDDTGVLDGTTYEGEIELGALLSDHPALGPCLIQALYGIAVGHLATGFDRTTFAGLVQDFEGSGSRVRALLTQITASEGFRYLPVPASDAP